MSVFWAFLLVALLAVLSAIDLRTFTLPDGLNALLAVGGLAHSLVVQSPTIPDAVLGALLAGGLMLFVAIAYRRARGREGLGLGDVKLAAAGGLWIGWAGVGPMILIAALAAAAAAALRAVREGRFDTMQPMPFGPFLALGILAAWSLVSADL